MTVYDFNAKSIDGRETPLSDFRGKVLLIVNVASRCGFTPQYAGLETLHQKYEGQGFAVLGFPCNQFGGQEPGTEAEIKSFCDTNYRITFPLFAKIDVNGVNADPLYKYLVEAKRGVLGTTAIKWNFTKFLINREGEPVKRYAPNEKPQDLEKDIERELLPPVRSA
jgi:glutathione peroxidase